MPIDFPTSPSTGQTYYYDGRTWRYTGEGWKVFYANTAPVAIADGGTGATSAAAALTNLGAASNAYVQATFAANSYVSTFAANTTVNARDAYLQNTFMIIAVSDETTAITAGNGKVRFRAPFAMTLWQIPRASVNTASTSGLVTVDINESGTSILGTDKLSIDANEKTSTTAATPTTLADTSIADDAEITIDIDSAGTGANGLKVTLYYSRT